jgi:hypothetical protein
MNVFEKEVTIAALRRELAYARSRVRPSATGHIITAAGWLEGRIEVLEEELNEEYKHLYSPKQEECRSEHL